MVTRVVHCKKEPYDEYIGRPSRWKNPFPITDKDSREYVIALFETWVKHSKEPNAQWVRDHVHELKGKTLGCWCKPRQCHGDILARMADGTS